jgi:hypothetical protein
LEHLATFKYIEGIGKRSPTASVEESFAIHLSGGIGSDHGAAGLLDVNQEDQLNLIVQNFSKKPL